MSGAVRYLFEDNETYLPVTMGQFEGLTNEILEKVNKVCAPNFLSGDYLAQILMSAIHALDHKHGIVKKSDLFESCVNRISCHVTFHASEEIRKRLGAPSGADDDQDNPVTDLPAGGQTNSGETKEASAQ